ncbi:exodeoxyribonuclease VII large subunit [Pyramidobacter sp. C12-8]|uniref:exodeoxyribonuclease VII large subunit n=1 Tax=Pyramidobacter sp. C12-8 TaxID=1943580 RepID=UPI00098F1A45|nr:exodeoxyribonuclease VII large subunit [Pyramidobacter sp. C12-8]OON88571.1 exodeoxyribonuclease VII large subunit [Pyramidobacter sp. C12-8]
MIRYGPVRVKKDAAPLTVDEVALRVKNLLDYDETLAHLVVEGELTDFKRHVSGHVYFVLKGQNASMPCVMFRGDAAGTLLWPAVGDRVVVSGSVRLYEARGAVQIYARKIYPLGLGAAARAKEELRLKLEKEGLFAPARKRSLPRYPRRAACVTSDTGAAVQDVIRQFRTRFPAAELIVVPCLVQGVRAAESAAAAMRRVSALAGVEVVLLVRGGGAKEDLNPFDDEELVREVARCPVPVVCGVGHEVDWSLCDLAADRREPTPTAAAASVFPDRMRELGGLAECARLLHMHADHGLRNERQMLASREENMRNFLGRLLENAAQRLDDLDEKTTFHARAELRQRQGQLDGYERSLRNLSPALLARRGYSLVMSGGRPLLSSVQVRCGDAIVVQTLDGDVKGRVDSVEPRGVNGKDAHIQ